MEGLHSKAGGGRGRRPWPMSFRTGRSRSRCGGARSAHGGRLGNDRFEDTGGLCGRCSMRPVRSSWPGPVSARHRHIGSGRRCRHRAQGRHRGRCGYGEHQRRLLSLGRTRHRPPLGVAGAPVRRVRLVGIPTSRSASCWCSRSSGRGDPLGAVTGGRGGRHLPGLLLQPERRAGTDETDRRPDRQWPTR